jgi:predicted nucleic acid-binding protein
MILLDTSVLARLADDRAETVLPDLRERTDETWVTSSLVTFEFFRPAQRRQNAHDVQAWLGQLLDGVEPFDEAAGLEAARLEAALSKQNRSLAMRDLLIAAHARALNGTFLTVDRGDFHRRPVQQLLDIDVLDVE